MKLIHSIMSEFIEEISKEEYINGMNEFIGYVGNADRNVGRHVKKGPFKIILGQEFDGFDSVEEALEEYQEIDILDILIVEKGETFAHAYNADLGSGFNSDHNLFGYVTKADKSTQHLIIVHEPYTIDEPMKGLREHINKELQKISPELTLEDDDVIINVM